MKNYLKRPLAGILALSLVFGSVSLQTFADELEWGTAQTEIAMIAGDVLRPSENVIITTADGNYPVNDETTIYIDKGTSCEFNLRIGDGVENCDDSIILGIADDAEKKIECKRNPTSDPLQETLTVKGITPGSYSVVVATKSGKANQKINLVVLSPLTEAKIKNGDKDITGSLGGVMIRDNQRLQLKIANTPSNTTDTIVWSVSDTTKAKISSDGVLTAERAGTITVTASAVNPYYDKYNYPAQQLKAYGLNQRTYSCSTTITILESNAMENLRFEDENGNTVSSINLNTGDKYDASSIFKYDVHTAGNSSTDEIIWKSSDTSVVAVDEKTGMLTAQNKSGFATVTAMTDSADPAKASFVVNVSSPATVLSFSSNKYMMDMDGRNEYDIIAIESPNTADEPLVCSVLQDENGNDIAEVIRITDGKTPNIKIIRLKALKTGTAKIKVSTDRIASDDGEAPENISATCELQVVNSIESYASFKIKEPIADVVYNGTVQCLKPIVTDAAGNELTEDKDYTLKYTGDTFNAGLVTVRVAGIESAAQYGTIDVTYQILPADISEITKPTLSNMTYNFGSELKPTVPAIKYRNLSLIRNTDFTVEYINNIDVGKATAIITGKGNYTGSIEADYEIQPKSISGAQVSGIAPITYTGDEITPDYTLTMNGNKTTLVENEDYTVEFSDNVNVGNASVVFTGIGNYTGVTSKKTFKITKKNVAEDNEVSVSDIPDQGYMGGMPVAPELTVTYNGRTLTEYVDYTLKFSDNCNPGNEASVVIDFSKSLNFTGSLKRFFAIVNRDVENPGKGIKAFDKNGKEIANDAVLYVDVKEVMDIDIAIDDADNTDDCLLVAIQSSNQNAGVAFTKYSRDGKTATVSVTGKKQGSFEMQISSLSGEMNKKLKFTILQPAEKLEIYNGKDKVTNGGVFVAENHQTAFTVKYTPGNTTDKVEWFVDDTEKAEISKDEGILTAKKAGTVIVTAKVKPSENSARGLYVTTTVTVVKANPITELNFPFKAIDLKVGSTYDCNAVVKKSIEDSTKSSTDNIIWESSDTSVAKVDQLTGKVTVLNKKGTATITATTDNMIPVTASFDINAYTPVTTMTFSAQNYTLLTGSEYEIELKENPSTANEKISWTVSDPGVLKVISSSYNSESNVQVLKVKALKTGNCKITAKTVREATINDPNPVQVEATCGAVVVDPIKMGNTTVTLSATAFEYNGKEQKPTVTVKYNGKALNEKTDYTVSYLNNTNIGTAKVTVTGVGRYVGTVSKTFAIKLPAVKNFKISKKTDNSATFTWTRNADASGYIIEKYSGGKWVQLTKLTSNSKLTYTASKLGAATTYSYRIKAYKTVGKSVYYSNVSATAKMTTPLGAVSVLKMKSATTTSVTLQWSKNASASGYELQQMKNNKWVTIYKPTKNTVVSYTVKNLKAGTATKFRIRAKKGSVYSTYTEFTAVTKPTNVSGFKKKTATSTAITLQWNKNTSATGYEVQQYKNNKWITIRKVSSNSTVTLSVSGLKAGTNYSFRIRAYKTVGKNTQYSGYTNYTAMTLPANMSGFKAKTTAKNYVTLGWSKNASASGYELQQMKNNKWVTIYKPTKNTVVSYTVKNLKAGTATKFRIRAKKGSVYSTYTEFTAVTKPTNVSGFKKKTATSTAITLQWNKNTSATGYEVQQYKNNKWITIRKVSSNSTVTLSVSGLKAGTNYSFRIRAYKTVGKNTQYSGYTNYTAMTLPANMSGFKAKTTAKNYVTLGWSKNSSATGYEIQRFNGKKWVSVTKVTKNSTVSYKVSKLSKNTSYQFRIRAYKTIGKNTQYSAWSKLTVRTKSK